MGRLAEAVAARGDYNQADALIEQINNPNTAAETLSRLATAATASGDHDRAEALIARITDPNQRSTALSQFAMAIVRASERASPAGEHLHDNSPMVVRARHLLGEALVTGSWTDVAPSLAYLDPPAVGALADELQVRWGLNGPADQQEGNES